MDIIRIILLLIFMFFFIKFLKKLFSKPKKKVKKKSIKQKKDFLPSKTKAKANRKYRKLLAEFKRKHKRKPSKNDLFKVVIAASHHTFPVKGRNVRRFTKGKIGHWNRQKVRKYLLKKYKIVENYKMR
jgi:hypothetical protein